MIIRELGIVVGKIDDATFELTDSTSDKLTGLVDSWKQNGIDILTAQEEDLQKGQASADLVINIALDHQRFGQVLEGELLMEGFDVQTA